MRSTMRAVTCKIWHIFHHNTQRLAEWPREREGERGVGGLRISIDNFHTAPSGGGNLQRMALLTWHSPLISVSPTPTQSPGRDSPLSLQFAVLPPRSPTSGSRAIYFPRSQSKVYPGPNYCYYFPRRRWREDEQQSHLRRVDTEGRTTATIINYQDGS